MTDGTSTRPGLIGKSIPRVEDARLLRGSGMYVADVRIPGMLEVTFVRSELPHALISAVDTSAAAAAPGVVMVATSDDMTDVSPVPDFPDWARPVATFPLAKGRVRYVGSPIAAVVADDRYLAEDAAELIVPDLHQLPAVATVEAAMTADAPRLYDGWDDNIIVDYQAQNPAADEPFDRLRSVSDSVFIGRHGASPMECRGVAAEYRHGRLTVWTSTQFAHIARSMYSYVLGLPEREIRVIAPDVGGGFGQKAEVYPEEYVVAWLAIKLGRPVRWIEDRQEHLVSACHARDTRIELEAAVHDDGRIESLRGTIWQDLGSGEIFPNGYNPAFVAAGSLVGPYKVNEQKISVVAVATNKTPCGAYRGFGIPEAVFAMERLVEKIALELEIDVHEVRRRNMIRPEDLPYTTAAGALIDSGSHLEAYDDAVAWGEAARERWTADLADDPRRVGVGYATYVEGVAATYFGTNGNWTSQDSADIRFERDGGVTVGVGLGAMGQGLWTMVATLTADALALPIERVRVVMGDTDTAPHGLGSWASRSVTVAGGAIQEAAIGLREKGTKIAAHLLEASPDDIELADGAFSVRGSPGHSVTWEQVATAALVRTLDLPEDIEPGLDARITYDPRGVDGRRLDHVPDERGRMNACPTYTNATHAAVVAVDDATGAASVLEYYVAHDCGVVINPLIVDGQIRGGVAQGVGGVLLEEFVYDEDAFPQSTTFMAYMVPTATDIPPIASGHFESPAPHLAWGAKGAGEAGIVGPSAAIATAIEDALAEYGIGRLCSTPITPSMLRSAIVAAGGGVGA